MINPSMLIIYKAIPCLFYFKEHMTSEVKSSGHRIELYTKSAVQGLEVTHGFIRC